MEQIKIKSYFCGISFLASFLLFSLISFQVSWITVFQSLGATLILWMVREQKIKELNQRTMTLLGNFWTVKTNGIEFSITDHDLASYWLEMLNSPKIMQAQAMNVMRVARNVLKKACFDIGIIVAITMTVGLIFAYPSFAKFATDVMNTPGQLAAFSGLIDRMFNIYFIVIAASIYVNGSGFGFINCFKTELAKTLSGNQSEGGVVSIIECVPDEQDRLAQFMQIS